MRLFIISGLSGSGKTIALHALEDAGFYCMDNLHLGLVSGVVRELLNTEPHLYEDAAIGIDVRSGLEKLSKLDRIIAEMRGMGVDLHLIFLKADNETLLRRFSETRRKHPLSRDDTPLLDAIEREQQLLSHVADMADLVIDTTPLNVHQLTQLIRERTGMGKDKSKGLSLLIQSFGFKMGAPLDSDFVFDVRCLPNPHWEPPLRKLTGHDHEVIEFLRRHESVEQMHQSLKDFLSQWIPVFEKENRRYVTVSVGCTGGQHRSVYLVERLADHFRKLRGHVVTTRHRELS